MAKKRTPILPQTDVPAPPIPSNVVPLKRRA